MAEKRIVYLEDDEEYISSLGDVLKELNYRIELAKTSAGAEKLASKLGPDLFLVSMDITNSDPSDLIQKAKKDKGLKKVPFIFLSENFDESNFYDEFEGADKKTSRFVRKPFEIENVVDIVETLVGLPTPPKGIFPISIESQRELIGIKKENEEFKAEISELKSKLGNYSKVNIAEKMAYLKELQKELEKIKKEKSSLEEEQSLLTKDLLQKNKEIGEKEKKLAQLKSEKISETNKMREAIEDIKKNMEEEQEKHKKAQNALREFYKPKLANMSKLEEKVGELEKGIAKAKEELKTKEKKLTDIEKQLTKEKGLREKLKKAFEEASGE